MNLTEKVGDWFFKLSLTFISGGVLTSVFKDEYYLLPVFAFLSVISVLISFYLFKKVKL